MPIPYTTPTGLNIYLLNVFVFKTFGVGEAFVLLPYVDTYGYSSYTPLGYFYTQSLRNSFVKIHTVSSIVLIIHAPYKNHRPAYNHLTTINAGRCCVSYPVADWALVLS